MTMTQILNSKNMSSATKIKEIKKIIKEAKKAYGNTGKKIKLDKVNTCNGQQSIKYLSDEDKLALVEVEIDNIRSQAIASVECTQGMVFDKKVTELIACNPVLSNLGKTVTSTWL